MATPAEWFAGARPRTLPAAVAPVLAGTGVAAWFHEPLWWAAALALVVSLALQVAVNYANDYSDGIRGTDDDRVGPMRLVGSRRASAAAVKRAMLLAFGVAAVAGTALVVATGLWWLLGVGVVCILAAWFYTGGSKPYGYLGLGEVMVFVFFGLVAVVGTTYVQVAALRKPDHGWFAYAESGRTGECVSGDCWVLDPNGWIVPALLGGIAIGALACAILVANNLRDIPTDTVAGKITLAVRLGDRRTRAFYGALVLLAAGALVGVAVLATPWALLGLPFLALAGPACRTVLDGAVGPGLIPVLQQTGLAELVWALGCGIGLAAA